LRTTPRNPLPTRTGHAPSRRWRTNRRGPAAQRGRARVRADGAKQRRNGHATTTSRATPRTGTHAIMTVRSSSLTFRCRQRRLAMGAFGRRARPSVVGGARRRRAYAGHLGAVRSTTLGPPQNVRSSASSRSTPSTKRPTSSSSCPVHATRSRHRAVPGAVIDKVLNPPSRTRNRDANGQSTRIRAASGITCWGTRSSRPRTRCRILSSRDGRSSSRRRTMTAALAIATAVACRLASQDAARSRTLVASRSRVGASTASGAPAVFFEVDLPHRAIAEVALSRRS